VAPYLARVTIFLVRHANAGTRRGWAGPDGARALSNRGESQAVMLADQLGDRPVKRVLSSPFVRCAQTVAPLAERLGVDVELDERLAEGRPFAPVVDLVAELPDDSVLCSHGDLIPEVMDALVRRGLEVVGVHDGRKGSRWEIERQGGQPSTARALPPPDRDPL
jgi:phosphohistidine phosphatase SixA